MKISTPIFHETDMDEFMSKCEEVGKQLKLLKQHYPSVWSAMTDQYSLSICGRENISQKLFKKKLEVMILQDEERRHK